MATFWLSSKENERSPLSSKGDVCDSFLADKQMRERPDITPMCGHTPQSQSTELHYA